jgi:hypothetical protein
LYHTIKTSIHRQAVHRELSIESRASALFDDLIMARPIAAAFPKALTLIGGILLVVTVSNIFFGFLIDSTQTVGSHSNQPWP